VTVDNSYCTPPTPVNSQSCNTQACPTYSCTGTTPINANLCTGDDTGLTVDTSKTVVTTCGAPKCEYTCSANYTLDGGLCKFNKPASLTGTCAGTSISLSWSAVSGATGYYLKMYDTINIWGGCSSPTDTCITTTATVYNTNTGVAGHEYSAWVQAYDASSSSESTSVLFTCAAPVYSWQYSVWGSCIGDCVTGIGTQARTVACKDASGNIVADSFCPLPKPTDLSQACTMPACSYSWVTGSWGACDASCGSGNQTRIVSCQRSDNTPVADSFCAPPKPNSTRSCPGLPECPLEPPIEVPV